MKNYYEVLGVSQEASQEEITKAYNLALKENTSSDASIRENRFYKLSEANFTLSNPRERAKYDFKMFGKPIAETKKAEKTQKVSGKRNPVLTGVYTILVIIGIFGLFGLLLPQNYTVYPVGCAISNSTNLTVSSSGALDFTHCQNAQAAEREVFKVDAAKNQVIETSPDSSDVVSLKDCTVQDNEHWSCGDYSNWSGGIFGAVVTSRSGDNFSESGLSGIYFVSESQWSSINNGKPGSCSSDSCGNKSSTSTTGSDNTAASSVTLGSDPVTQNNVNYTFDINNMGSTIHDDDGKFSGKTTNGAWEAVTVHMTNSSDTNIQVTPTEFQLIDQNQRQYQPTAWYLCNDTTEHQGSDYGGSITLKPGINCDTQLLFETAKDSNAFTLLMNYTN